MYSLLCHVGLLPLLMIFLRPLCIARDQEREYSHSSIMQRQPFNYQIGLVFGFTGMALVLMGLLLGMKNLQLAILGRRI